MQDIAWWERAVVYQIYPRSFMDKDGNGIGDLEGIRSRLDHIVRIGADAIWLSPIYPSPMADFGYDISDYTGIHPIFGTMADFDRLLDEAHALGLKLILDFVPNHTSDRHPWFEEARASRDSPKRDWYIWQDPAPDGGPPNNWMSQFGGSAWERDETTGQYYYHAFLKQQPDLNWRNPAVREAMYDVLRFWLERGVDGFRVDVIWHLIKDDRFRDNPPNPDFKPGDPPHHRFLDRYASDRPEVHDVLAEMRRVLEEHDGRVLIGEIYLPVERLVTYYGDGQGAHLPFNFQLLAAPWDARHIAGLIQEYEEHLPESGWPNWVLGNHDKPRIASRVGLAQARVAAMLLLTLRGTPTLYYGDEIGMQDVPVPPDRVQDPYEKNVPGMGLGRDPQRTPMQWDGTANAGFTRGAPWLPVAANFTEVNVAEQAADPTSFLSLYRRLIALRRAEDALTIGSYRGLDMAGDILAYIRRHGDRRFLIVLNIASEPEAVVFRTAEVKGRVLLSTHLDRDGETVQNRVDLRPDEGAVILLD